MIAYIIFAIAPFELYNGATASMDFSDIDLLSSGSDINIFPFSALLKKSYILTLILPIE
ncbi:MAG: hypothetical protein K5657_09435 [Desulfovibrio sp.]|nr:hypothetical protein [Desulfovibrio sp.]